MAMAVADSGVYSSLAMLSKNTPDERLMSINSEIDSF
jgi:hypothetical protein